nr:hypothetical protein CFP56_18809 [Quercus suber]
MVITRICMIKPRRYDLRAENIRKKVVTVPGFFTKKKPASHTTPYVSPPQTSPPSVQQATSGTSHPSPRTFNEIPENRGLGSVSISGTTNQRIRDKTEEVSGTSSSIRGDFEKTLQDLDRDILSCEKVIEDPRVSNNLPPAHEQLHSAHIAHLVGPTNKHPIVQPISPSPLYDRSNMDQDQNSFTTQSEGKWLRIQRPFHLKENINPEPVLGKRLPLTHLESSTPLKRRARAGAAQDENFPPSAEAALQPRRGP